MASKQEQLYALIAPVVEAMECQLWGMDYMSRGRYTTLRLYIDRDAADGGVTLDDCERVSRQVGSVLDVEDPIGNRYTLEVSSPGVDRPLFSAEQYALYVGEEVSLKTRAPIDGRRKFKGRLEAVSGDSVVLIVDGVERTLAIGSIEKANLVPRL